MVEPVIAYAHSPPQSEKSGEIEYYFIYLRDKKKKLERRGLRKRGGGENSPVSPPVDPPLQRRQRQRQRHELRILLVEQGKISVLHVHVTTFPDPVWS